jgi:hypothetical protein
MTTDLPSWADPETSRDPESGFLHPRQCESYLPGHTVHWIQANRSAGQPHETGTLIGVEGNVITVEVDGTTKTYRNHEVERLVEIVGLGGEVRICESYSILQGGGNYCFSIVDASKPWRECGDEPLTDTSAEGLVDRLTSHGGFVV